MSVILGSGDYRYRVEEGWGRLPDGWSFHEVGAVGVDRNDNVYVFNRGEHPMIVFDREGNFLRSWGEGMFPRAHGVHMAPDDTIFCTDDGAHCVRKCTLDGKVLMTHRHARQTRAIHERRAVLPLHPHRAIAQGRDLRHRRLRQCPGPQIHTRREIPDSRGASAASVRASSTCRTTSIATPTAGSTSPIARTTACRCSTGTASSRPPGATSFTARARCT